MKLFCVIFLIIAALLACNTNNKFVPKPQTFLRIDLPEKTYNTYEDSCAFKFDIPSYAKIKKAKFGNSCSKDLDLGVLNGIVSLSFIEMDTSLATYINYAIDKVDEHKIKASSIKDTNIIRQRDKVYGTFFTLEGNVATPFQFYLTDSTSLFMRGAVYFNAKPNYDSIKPVLDFVKKDMLHLLKTTYWK